MQALQRVQTSRSIGFSWRHSTSKAPSQPDRPVTLPDQTGYLRSSGSSPAAGSDQHASLPAAPTSRSAQSSAAAAGPMTSTWPCDLNSTAGAGSGSGSAAIAISAAILGVDFSAGPAAELADVHELDALLRNLGEQRRFLRAGDDDVLAAAERGLERADVLAAQLVVHGERLARLERRRERLRVERDGAVAAADLKRLASQARRAWTVAVAVPIPAPGPAPPQPPPASPAPAFLRRSNSSVRAWLSVFSISSGIGSAMVQSPE